MLINEILNEMNECSAEVCGSRSLANTRQLDLVEKRMCRDCTLNLDKTIRYHTHVNTFISVVRPLMTRLDLEE